MPRCKKLPYWALETSRFGCFIAFGVAIYGLWSLRHDLNFNQKEIDWKTLRYFLLILSMICVFLFIMAIHVTLQEEKAKFNLNTFRTIGIIITGCSTTGLTIGVIMTALKDSNNIIKLNILVACLSVSFMIFIAFLTRLCGVKELKHNTSIEKYRSIVEKSY